MPDQTAKRRRVAGGGCIPANGAVLGDADPENRHTMVEAGGAYGVCRCLGEIWT